MLITLLGEEIVNSSVDRIMTPCCLEIRGIISCIKWDFCEEKCLERNDR